MSAPDTMCFIRGCGAPASGVGGRFPHPLCERHLAQDRDRVRQLQDTVQRKLLPLKTQRDKLRIDQETLAAELQEAEDVLDAAVQSLIKWKESVVSRLTERHDSTLQKLREYSVLQEYESAVGAAESANDMRRVFQLAFDMEFQCNELVEEETRADADCGDERRCVGDVSGGLRDLQLMIDRQMQNVMQLCESVDIPKYSDVVCEPLKSVENLDGKPVLVTSCSNTVGFYGDSSGRVVKAESEGDGRVKLPDTCLFILFHLKDKKDYFLVVSVDGSVRFRCHCALDWKKYVTGLHCDSQRQLLFIAKSDLVTVADLSGEVSRVINSHSLGLTMSGIRGIDGNSDKIFVIDVVEKKLLGIGKDDGTVTTVINVSKQISGVKCYASLSISGSAVYFASLPSFDQVWKFCLTSKQLITAYPTKCSGFALFKNCFAVAAHRSGLLFVSEYNNHVVRVIRSDGALVQTLGVEGMSGSDGGKINYPWGLTLVPGDPQMLAVCQYNGKSVSLFKLRFV